MFKPYFYFAVANWTAAMCTASTMMLGFAKAMHTLHR